MAKCTSGSCHSKPLDQLAAILAAMIAVSSSSRHAVSPTGFFRGECVAAGNPHADPSSDGCGFGHEGSTLVWVPTMKIQDVREQQT